MPRAATSKTAISANSPFSPLPHLPVRLRQWKRRSPTLQAFQTAIQIGMIDVWRQHCEINRVVTLAGWALAVNLTALLDEFSNLHGQPPGRPRRNFRADVRWFQLADLNQVTTAKSPRGAARLFFYSTACSMHPSNARIFPASSSAVNGF
jgi:hypothetical protein